MSNYMIPRSAPGCKSEPALSPGTDLICPQPACRSNCYFSSQAQRVWCPTCGWALTLTDEQTTEITEALLSISDLPIAAYLLILAAQCPPATLDTLLLTADHTAPAYLVEGSTP